jgi:hypothetical protein
VPVFRMRPYKPRSRVAVGGTIKIPPCSKALSAEHRPKFVAQSPVNKTNKLFSSLIHDKFPL